MRAQLLFSALLLGASLGSHATQSTAPKAVVQDQVLSTLFYPANRIVGVWQIHVSLHPCANPSAPPTEFFALNTYYVGGTLSDTNSFPPGLRKPGMGVWSYDWRQRKWRSRMTFMRFVNGVFDGVNVANNELTMLDNNHNTADVHAYVLNLDGSVRVELCGTADGERFDL